MFLQLIVIGNLGKDPEMRFTPSGSAVTSFSVATSHQYTNAAGEKIKETTWVRVTAWGKQAETCNTYLKKGSKVMVSGRLQSDQSSGGPRVWTDKEGNARAQYEMTSERVVFLSAANTSEKTGDDQGAFGQPEDDIPF